MSFSKKNKKHCNSEWELLNTSLPRGTSSNSVIISVLQVLGATWTLIEPQSPKEQEKSLKLSTVKLAQFSCPLLMLKSRVKMFFQIQGQFR